MSAVTLADRGFAAWSRIQIASILSGIAEAIITPVAAVPSDNPGKAAYIAGFEAGMRATCEAFGLAYRRPRKDSQD